MSKNAQGVPDPGGVFNVKVRLYLYIDIMNIKKTINATNIIDISCVFGVLYGIMRNEKRNKKSMENSEVFIDLLWLVCCTDPGKCRKLLSILRRVEKDLLKDRKDAALHDIVHQFCEVIIYLKAEKKGKKNEKERSHKIKNDE